MINIHICVLFVRHWTQSVKMWHKLEGSDSEAQAHRETCSLLTGKKSQWLTTAMAVQHRLARAQLPQAAMQCKRP